MINGINKDKGDRPMMTGNGKTDVPEESEGVDELPKGWSEATNPSSGND